MKKNLLRKLIGVVTSFGIMTTCQTFGVMAADSELSDDIVVLYTNDVHTYIDGALSYDVVAAIKDDLQTKYKYVLLADAGDHIQGTAYGAMDKGESIIRMMNEADYDAATLGNHEFDYNMSGCLNAIEHAEFEYVSCNFYKESDGVRGENVLDSYTLFDCGDEKVAFVGITTPETFSKSTPAYFQDENGRLIYNISGGDDGAALRRDLQDAIDSAEAEGATTIIALGHLGTDSSSSPWTSKETISAVSGLDAFIDGHSHSTIKGEKISDKDGKDVVLTQTGEYFKRIGMMVIDSETGNIETDFIEYDKEKQTLSSSLYDGTEVISQEAVRKIKDDWISEIEEKLGKTIGKASVTFDNYDADGKRLVRSEETNTGDFAADALYYLFDNMDLDVDVAVMNGGGIRNKAITGDISYKTCKDIHPFGNVACLQKVSGQQILDMLEWGAQNAGVSEAGSFLHVSGIKYKIDTSVPNTIQKGDMDLWVGGPSVYRVFDVMVYNKETNSWNELDLKAEYNLAGYNYTLRNLGDGYSMLSGAVNVLDYVMEDYMVLANYIEGFENKTVEADNSPLMKKYSGFSVDYGRLNGSGRITIVDGKAVPEITEKPEEVTTTSAATVSSESTTTTTTTTTNSSTVASSPATGHNDLTAVYFVILMISGCMISVMVMRDKKKN
ncbi:MAG: bifunctional metallophosphatase/5'-nucleotidase [Ruminococcus sp.]|nr:bifunctional metallophosphatase/5'-nucleotidase [Ruminococcus sp.]